MERFKIFIACPISKYLTEEGMNKEFENFIKEIYQTCKEYSEETFMALYREEYGKARMSDAECTPLDFEEMKDTDVVIAFPEDSMGVAVELGWASSMKKRIMLILNEKYEGSPLIRALYTVTDAKSISISAEESYYYHKDYIIDQIRNYLTSIVMIKEV